MKRNKFLFRMANVAIDYARHVLLRVLFTKQMQTKKQKWDENSQFLQIISLWGVYELKLLCSYLHYGRHRKYILF